MKVSVALCTYNGERFLLKQLESILHQTHQPDELVVVDDQSADSTVHILRAFAADHPGFNVRFFENETNLGFVRNFEKAATLCEGEVIFFSDQDDIWHPEKIARLLPSFENASVHAVYHDGLLIDESDNQTGQTLFNTRRRARLEKGLSREADEVVSNIDINGCTMGFRKSFLQQHPLPSKQFPELWGHDHWWALHAYACGSMVVSEEKLLFYRVHSENTSGKINTGFEFDKVLKNLKDARRQGNDFYYQRYRQLKKSLDAIEKNLILNEAHYRLFVQEVQKFVDINQKRASLKQLTFPKKLVAVYQISRTGFYRKYLNGGATALRDFFL